MDVAAQVHRQLETLHLRDRIKPGATIAITAGSRGIHQIDQILAAVVAFFRRIGGEPFLVPAMGSHGGATADGQRRVLATLNITPEACGCEIRATMETVRVCEAPEGFPVLFDRFAFEADHVFVVNRVKPHTRFTGNIQSGLMKMMLIGLGKHAGAALYHRAILEFDFPQIVRSVAAEVVARCHILGGLAIVENGLEETALLEAVAAEQIEAREPELLRLAEQWMARLPLDELDLLLVDRIGKDISGTGMDTNVIGRKQFDHLALGDERPRIRYIAVRDLTEATGGNASGIGIAEFCRRRVVDAMDQVITATNCITANHPTGAMIPIAMESDREILDAALGSIGLRAAHEARLAWIVDTLRLTRFYCSESLRDTVQAHPALSIAGPTLAMPLDDSGNLPDLAFPQFG